MGNGYENLQDMGKEEMRRTVSEAVRNREYQVWYQPQVDMGTGEIFGAEAWCAGGILKKACFCRDILFLPWKRTG